MFNPLLLLSKISFPKDEEENSIRKSKDKRIKCLRSADVTLQRLAAAIIIQSAFRGWHTRRKYLAVKFYNLSYKSRKGSVGRENKFHGELDLTVQENLILKYYRYCGYCEKLYDQTPAFPHFAAAFIQSMWRMVITRSIWKKYSALEQSEKTGRASVRVRSRLSKYGSLLAKESNDKSALVLTGLSAGIHTTLATGNQSVTLTGHQTVIPGRQTAVAANQGIKSGNQNAILGKPGNQTAILGKPGNQTVMTTVRPIMSVWDRYAIIIQNAWRSHNGKRIFAFYKSLLSIWQSNNSSRLLKFINPQESKLIEAATGLHIKFRLGGVRLFITNSFQEYFPPTVYYKIFVHNPIVDLNSFAPRNYTREAKQILPSYIFNNLTPMIDQTVDGWYSRVENNTWRPISDKLWDLRNSPEFNPLLPSTKTVQFHHSQFVRKQELERRKKKKRLEWLRKMYKEGMHMAKENTVHKLEVVQEDDENVEDLEHELDTDRLIKWTEALDFDQYFEDWTQLATSGPTGRIHLKSIPNYAIGVNMDQMTQRSFTPHTQVSLSDLLLK